MLMKILQLVSNHFHQVEQRKKLFIIVPITEPIPPMKNAKRVGPASLIIFLKSALNSSKGIAKGTKYDQTISYAGAALGMIDKLDKTNVPSIATTTAERREPIFVFSAQRLNAATEINIAHNIQC